MSNPKILAGIYETLYWQGSTPTAPAVGKTNIFIDNTGIIYAQQSDTSLEEMFRGGTHVNQKGQFNGLISNMPNNNDYALDLKASAVPTVPVFRVKNSSDVSQFEIDHLGKATGKALVLTGGAVTAGYQSISNTIEWNNAGVTFNNWNIDILDTNSNIASTFFNFKIGGSSRASLNKGGGLTLAGSATIGASSNIAFNGRSLIFSPSNGNILLTNNSSNDFGLLVLGDDTSSFPALKRSTTDLEVKLGDDSGYTKISSSALRLYGATSGNILISVPATITSYNLVLPSAAPGGNVYALTVNMDGTSQYTALTGGVTLNGVSASTGNATIDNTNYLEEWQWSTLAATGFKLSSSSTAAASNAQKLFELALSGANSTSTQTTYSAYMTNAHTGTSSTNIGLYISASGGTNNYGLIIENGNTGLGTITPIEKLQVHGDVHFGGTTGFLGGFGSTDQSVSNIYICSNIKNIAGTPTQILTSVASWMTRTGGVSQDNWEIARIAAGGSYAARSIFFLMGSTGKIAFGSSSLPTERYSFNGSIRLADNSSTTALNEYYAVYSAGGNLYGMTLGYTNSRYQNSIVAPNSGDISLAFHAATTFPTGQSSFSFPFRFNASGQVIIAQGTLTSNVPFINHTSVWNSVGITFDNIISNVTNSASATASTLLKLQVGGVNKFRVSVSGDTYIDGGNLYLQSHAIYLDTSNPNFWAIAKSGSNIDIAGQPVSTARLNIVESAGGISRLSVRYDVNAVGVGIYTATSLLHIVQNTDSTDTTNPVGLNLTSVGAAGELTAASGTQVFAQIFPIVNQSGTAGYTVLKINNTLTAGGSGTKLLLDAQHNSASVFTISTLGNVIMSGGITAGAAGYLQFSGGSSIGNNGDGTIVLLNNAGNGFSLLHFGGTTSSFPSLKRNTTFLEFKLADDSAYTIAKASIFDGITGFRVNGAATSGNLLMGDGTNFVSRALILSQPTVGTNTANTTAETNGLNYTLAANTLTANSKLIVRFIVSMNSAAGANFTLRLKIGGTEYHGEVITVPGSVSNRILELTWEIKNLNATNVNISMVSKTEHDATTGGSAPFDDLAGKVFRSDNILAVDFTSSQAIVASIQMSAAAAATNWTLIDAEVMKLN